MITPWTRVVFLNGPPRSGKDTAGAALREIEFQRLLPNVIVQPVKFAAPIGVAIAVFLGISVFEWQTLLEKSKEQGETAVTALGYSPRKAMIGLSEDWAKKQFSQDVFGKLAVARMKVTRQRWMDSNIIFTVTDSGFISEALPVVKEFGAENCLLVQLHKIGTSFEGDSRSYLNLLDFPTGVVSCQIDNDKTLPAFEDTVTRSVLKWLQAAHMDGAGKNAMKTNG